MNNLEKNPHEIQPEVQIIPEDKSTPTPIEVIEGALLDLENEEEEEDKPLTPQEERHTLQ